MGAVGVRSCPPMLSGRPTQDQWNALGLNSATIESKKQQRGRGLRLGDRQLSLSLTDLACNIDTGVWGRAAGKLLCQDQGQKGVCTHSGPPTHDVRRSDLFSFETWPVGRAHTGSGCRTTPGVLRGGVLTRAVCVSLHGLKMRHGGFRPNPPFLGLNLQCGFS